MAKKRKAADPFNEFYVQAITPLKNRITDLENSSTSQGLAIEIGDNQPAGENFIADLIAD